MLWRPLRWHVAGAATLPGWSARASSGSSCDRNPKYTRERPRLSGGVQRASQTGRDAQRPRGGRERAYCAQQRAEHGPRERAEGRRLLARARPCGALGVRVAGHPKGCGQRSHMEKVRVCKITPKFKNIR